MRVGFLDGSVGWDGCLPGNRVCILILYKSLHLKWGFGWDLESWGGRGVMSWGSVGFRTANATPA